MATVSRWKRIADFQAAIAKERQAVDVENPTPRVVLEQALLASRADGSPAWDIRVQAARALASMPPDEPDGSDDPPPRTVIYVAPDDPRVGREEPLDAVA